MRLLGSTPVAVLAVLLLGGCTVGPDFTTPHSWWPASWSTGRPPPVRVASTTTEAPIDPAWWASFGDPELTALERRVADANLDVRTATARLSESRAERGIVTGRAGPDLGAGAAYARERFSPSGVAGRLAPDTPEATEPFDLWQAGFDAFWELDLWGRGRRQAEAADAGVEASAEARRAALLSVMAEVARRYVALRGVQRQQEIAEANLRLARHSLALARHRGAPLDVAEAAAQLATVSALRPRLRQQEEALGNRLGLLLGMPPGALRAELAATKPIPPVPPQVPVGLPSTLARRRPDIRAAEARLHAATAAIGVAVANFYPSITLTGSLGVQAVRLSDLAGWNAVQYAAGPGITLPIFDGGRLSATLRLRKAQQTEAAIAYERAVLRAWHEVDDALTAYEAEQIRRRALREAVAQSRRALTLAQGRYKDGAVDFLRVLDAGRSLLAVELQYAQSTTAVSTNLIALYKALGGGWEERYPRGDKKKEDEED